MSRHPVAATLSSVTRALLDLSAAEVATRIQAVTVTAAVGPVVVRVGDEVHGCRNVGIDLPRGRRSAAEGRALGNRVWAALEVAGVVMVATAGAPRGTGDILGNVRVGRSP